MKRIEVKKESTDKSYDVNAVTITALSTKSPTCTAILSQARDRIFTEQNSIEQWSIIPE